MSSIEDQLTKEAAKEMLKEINKKMFTQKKDAISKFVEYIETTQPKLSSSTVNYILKGDRKYPGVIHGCGHFNWKGSFHKYSASILDLVQMMLSNAYDYHETVIRCFLKLSREEIEGMHLPDHARKKSGNNAAANWILDLLKQNGVEVSLDKTASPRRFSRGDGKNEGYQTSASAITASVSRSPGAYNQSTSMALGSSRIKGSRSLDSPKPPTPSATSPQVHASHSNLTSEDAKKKKGFMNFLSGFFHRRPNKQVLEQKGILKSAGVFGAPLDEVVSKHGMYGLPAVVVDCVEKLQRESLLHVGLFRIPGNNTNIIKLKQQYDYGGPVNLKEETANDISGLLKLYLRDMPEPLFPFQTYDTFLKAYESTQGGGDGADVLRVVERMPGSRRRLMKYLFEFLHLLSLNSAVNMMKSRNIAICLAPNLLRPRQETLQSVALDASAVTGVVKWLIDHTKPETRRTSAGAGARPKAHSDEKADTGRPRSRPISPQHSKSNTAPNIPSNPITPNSKLPPGWREVTSNGKTYFYNEKLKFSQWERPTEPSPKPHLRTASTTPPTAALPTVMEQKKGKRKGPPAFTKKKKRLDASVGEAGKLPGNISPRKPPTSPRTPIKEESSLPEGWTSHVEKRTGKIFYYHTSTKTSQW
eukprot:CAMPEP_0197540854 /NCGR_PEP_ID=MMETSP1318-20131121/66830_1 /TAXON_ID=552666 /ORGANISM="Partenskyella glossopodia, Strain RCC365" /LENGTH=643 /DNA_ID=CAMNT_0043099961 /DNA_START=109 /DNA_END=2037 /DNA_ORIENTATION=-